MKVFMHTLGCKVNQSEAESVLADLIEKGNVQVQNAEDADVILLSTCAVTNEAERKSRQIAHKYATMNPNAELIICGCASQKDKSQFMGISKSEIVIGCAGKNQLSTLNNDIKFGTLPEDFEEMTVAMPSQTRAHIKIQDGCSNFCSYCLIPYLRGKSRSRNLDSILSEIYEISKHTTEIVVTGINITDFKIDGEFGLPILMKKLESLPSRIRLGSLEQSVISDEFLKQLSSMPNFCPHFHLSLQSGSLSELQRMNRHYTPTEFLNQILLIRKYFPLAAITTDLIVGFPEQSEKEFCETKEFIKLCKFYEMHIFKYSKRSGTKAELMASVPPKDIKRRIFEITQIASEMKKDFENECLNHEFDLLIEEFDGKIAKGKTENYLDAFCIAQNVEEGQIIRVKAKEITPNGIFCEEIKK